MLSSNTRVDARPLNLMPLAKSDKHLAHLHPTLTIPSSQCRLSTSIHRSIFATLMWAADLIILGRDLFANLDEQLICLKSVYQLRLDSNDQPIRYRVPACQRGYRWTHQQVSQLLEDIRDFTQRENPQPAEFYCLQTLVLRLNEGTYEVVDGQQRLTTVLLILRHLMNGLRSAFSRNFTRSCTTRARRASISGQAIRRIGVIEYRFVSHLPISEDHRGLV